MRPHGTPAQLETRRRLAARMFKAGKNIIQVALLIGCSKSSASRWRQAWDEDGLRSLRAKPIPGRPPKLPISKHQALLRLLCKGAPHFGYATDLWTTQRIADVIRRHFNVSYDRDHIGPLMRSLDRSCQKPIRRATERDEEAIARWKAVEWPKIKKNETTWGPSRLPRRKRVPPDPERTKDLGTQG